MAQTPQVQLGIAGASVIIWLSLMTTKAASALTGAEGETALANVPGRETVAKHETKPDGRDVTGAK